MSIRSEVGNFTYSVQDVLSSAVTSAKTHIENIVGTATTGFTNLFSGGFTGMSESGMIDLTNAIERYCDELQSTIDGFDQTGDISVAFAGEYLTSGIYDYIDAIKKLLEAYISTLKQEVEEADAAYKNLEVVTANVGDDASNMANDIRAEAHNITLD